MCKKDFRVGEIYEIDLKDVRIKEKIHKKPMSLNKGLRNIIKNNKYNHFNDIILPVRITDHGNVVLLSNRSGYEVMWYGQQNTVKVKVYNNTNRLDYLRTQKFYCNANINSITVEKDYVKRYEEDESRKDRLKTQREYYSTNNTFTDAILLKRINNNIVLKGGYTKYIIAKELGLKEIDAIFI